MFLIGAAAAMADGVPLAKGDVLAGTGEGKITHFDPTGKVLDTLNTTSSSSEDTGMCFDAGGDLFSTNFEANTMSKFDGGGNLLLASFGSGFNSSPESCVFDTAGNVYVGQGNGSEVLKFDPSGNLLKSFAPETGPRGTDWIDLAADQCTLHYTSEGNEIKAFNVCTNEQLTPFATELPASPCYAHRILADGSELVACSSVVLHVDSTGKVIKTYELEREGGGSPSQLFALNLDPDGTSFWTAEITFSAEIWKVDIATGTVLKQFNSSAPVDVAGLAVVGECTSSEGSIRLAPASAENPVGTEHTVTATVSEGCGKPQSGVTVTFKVTGANPQTGTGTTNASGEASFTYKGENEGTDHIVASFESEGKTETSNEVTKIWTKEGQSPPPTELTTSLSGEGKTGASIAVKEGTAVTDEATLSGENAAKAGGTVTYRVFSDNKCEGSSSEAGTVTVSEGKVPASNAETLAPGTYYWQASYSGDTENASSKSTCGSEILTVEKPVVTGCNKITGSGQYGEGEELEKLANNLSTNLATKRQKFTFSWEHGKEKFAAKEFEKAVCKVTRHGFVFKGNVEGTLNKVPEYIASYVFKVNTEEEIVFVKIKIRNEKTHELVEEFEIEELEESTEEVS